MSLNDLVSCIVLSYKKFDFFYENIDSILEQDYSNIEIIVCDDCSPNFEKDKILEYIKLKSGKNISNVIVYHQENNVGTVKNFNTAINLSKGKYICPLSSDDLFIDKYIISKVVNFLSKNNLIIATSYRDVYSEDLSKFIEKAPSDSDVSLFEKDPLTIYKQLAIRNFISGASTYYTREFFDKYNLFNESYLLLEDSPKYLSFCRQGGKIGFTNFTTIKYRYGGISTGKVINVKLKMDLKLSLETEVLPYKNILGFFLYRRIKNIYKRTFFQTTSFNRFIRRLSYLDVIIFEIIFPKKKHNL